MIANDYSEDMLYYVMLLYVDLINEYRAYNEDYQSYVHFVNIHVHNHGLHYWCITIQKNIQHIWTTNGIFM